MFLLVGLQTSEVLEVHRNCLFTMFTYALLFLFTKIISIGHTCDGAIPWLIDYTREAQKVQEPPVDYRHGMWKFIWDFQVDYIF